MSTNTTDLMHRWEKTSRTTCAERYPERIEFRDGGLYFGEKDPPGSYTVWDAGTWEVPDGSHIKMSTANDAVLTYTVSLSEGTLTFIDGNKCEIQYKKRE
jgi:hypothetical protein